MPVDIKYHENGKPFCLIERRLDGTAHGMCRNWDEAGLLTMEGEYADRKPIGVWKNWHSNGNPFVETLYENGAIKAMQSYHYSGGKEWNGQYATRRKKDGQWQRFHENGRLHILATFHNGPCSGIWRIWDQNGNELAPEIHIGGKDYDWDEYGEVFFPNTDPAKRCPHKSCELIW